MFLKIKSNSFICFDCGVLNEKDVELVNHKFFVNLSVIGQISIKKCSVKVNKNLKICELKYKIEFDRFVDDGVLNHFTLFFKEKEDKEFRRIKKYLIKENNYGKV